MNAEQWVDFYGYRQRNRECRRAPAGWWCSRGAEHAGPCAAHPRWWNLVGQWHNR